MKKTLLLLALVLPATKTFSQNGRRDSLNLFTTAFKINVNGFRAGIEQKVFKRLTLQLEGLYLGRHLVKINPQLRYYPKLFREQLAYFAIGYYYKHQENDFIDSVRIVGTSPYYTKEFHVSKYIHTLTFNYGFMYEEKICKRFIRFEFNLGLGIRFKKSNRYGLLANEEIDFREAFVMRPQAYQDTKGKFALYPELNATWTIVLPIQK